MKSALGPGRYHFLLESAVEAMLIVDDDGVILMMNATAERTIAFPLGDMVGRNLAAFVVPVVEGRAEWDGAVRGRGGRLTPSRFSAWSLDGGRLRAVTLRPGRGIERQPPNPGEIELGIRDILEFAADAVVVADDSGRIVIVNAEAESLFGYTRQEMVGQPIEMLVPMAARDRHRAERTAYLDQPRKRLMGDGVELQGRRKDGSAAPVEISLSPIETRAGRFVASVVRDIRMRKEAERRLASAEARYRGLLEAAPDAMVVADDSGAMVLVNIQAERMFGYPRRELIGQPLTLLAPIGLAEEVARAREDGATDRSAGVFSLEGRRSDGDCFPIEVRISLSADSEGLLITAAIRDISARRRAEALLAEKVAEGSRLNTQLATALQMAHAAEHDFLTGLPNRKLLNDRIGQAITRAQRNQSRVAVLFVDLDGFKRINDSLGHALGDRLLQEVARRLEHSVRASDTVSRQGGDEFVILLPEIGDGPDVELIARKVLRAVAEPYVIGTHELHVTASIGGAIYPSDGPDPDGLIRNADIAMYHAKASGRRAYRAFRPAMSVKADERRALEEELRLALDRGEFVLHYQPQFETATLDAIGVEALVRWRHPARGLIGPDTFLSVAEESGLMMAIGAWVLHEACLQSRVWIDRGLAPLTMAVNVSAAEFGHAGFPNRVFEVLAATGLRAADLRVEVTEAALMNHPDAAEATIRSLRAAGVGIVIDDFGVGYSSLSHLTRFPIDGLKIDSSLMGGLTGPGRDSAVVNAVIGVARALGLHAIAEGVETLEQYEILRARGCHAVQGHCFGRPAPPETLSTNGWPPRPFR